MTFCTLLRNGGRKGQQDTGKPMLKGSGEINVAKKWRVEMGAGYGDGNAEKADC